MSKKKCFYCGFLNQSNSLFCEECGKKLEYICPKCGYVAHEATNFCVNCGEKFDVVDDHVEENTKEDSLSEEVTENEEQAELEEEVSEEEKETDAEDASESEEIEEPENGEEDINQSEEDFRICPNCHTKNELSALFCEGCGRKLIDDSDEEEQTEVEEEVSEQEVESNDEEEQSELNEEVSEEQEETDAEDASESKETESEEEDANLSEEEYVRVCGYCHTENPLSALFCEGCGRKLIDDRDEEEQTEVEEEVSEQEVESDDVDEQAESNEDFSEEVKEVNEEDASESEETEIEEEDANSSEEEYVRVCGYCHTENPLSALFCEGCGKKLIDDSDEDEESHEQEIDSSDEEEQNESNEGFSEEVKEVNEEDASESEETEIEEEDANSSEEEYVRVCGYCHTENPLSALFCEGCGKKLIDDSDEDEESHEQEIDSSDEEEQNESNEGFSEEVKEVNEEDAFESEETEIEEEDANLSEEEYVRVCGYCHTENPLSVVYCEGCGRRLIGDEFDEQEVNFDEDEETQTNVEEDTTADGNETCKKANEQADSNEQEIQTELKEESIEEKVEIGEGIHEHVEKIEVDSEETDDLLEKQTLKGKTPNHIEESDVVDKDAEAIQSLKTTTDASEVLENLSDKNQKSKKKKILFIVLLLLLIIVAIGCYLFFCTDIFDKKENTPNTEEKVELILVPNVVGEDIDVAKKKLEELSLKVEIEEEVTDNLDDIGKVFEQDIVDEEVEEGTLVTLRTYVSHEKVEMISVVESNVEEATKKLEELGLKVIVKEEYSEQAAGTIIKQNIPANDEVSQGSVVEIVVSKGPAEETSQEGNKDSSSNNNSANNSNGNSNSNNNNTNNSSNNNNSTNDSPASSTESTWSEWVDALPSNVNSSQYQIETKTQYRYRTTETMESAQASMPGWNLSYITTVTGGWSDVQRIQDVSDEQLANYRNDSNYQILSETKAYYKIDTIHCDKISGEKGSVLPSSDGTCPSGYKVHEAWTTSPTNRNVGGLITSVCGQPNLTVDSTITKSTLMWTIQARTKVIEKIYHYTRLTDWSAWQDEKVEASNNRRVETKTVYRYRKI